MTTGCTLADQDQLEELGTVESEGKRAGATTTSGPTCSSTTDYMADANNCGTCGNVCGSGLCYSGVCADATAGHVFAIGHGYATSNRALDKLLGNAVFMNERAPVRVLAYAGTAPATLVSGTNAAIDRQATARGRTWQRTQVTSSADVAFNLPNADVFLVYAQPQQDSTYLNYLGDEWGLYLQQFTRRGGIVVVLDTASTNAGTPEVLTRTGLMTLGGRTTLTGNAFVGVAEDAGAARMPMMFATSNSVAWAPSSWTNVINSDAGQAMVVHRAIY
ncbi:MAG: hypothetical protein H0V17_05320 [Deltaproteobacteria bacterium]|nr:hypothetical protein [Deltaproteobacteria bacterium]